MSERPQLNPRERMAIDPPRDARTGRGGSAPRTSARSTWASRRSSPRRRPSAACECKNPPCIEGCPVRVNIPRFIDLVAGGDLHGCRRIAPRRQRPALRDRAGLPPGEPVRGSLRPRQEGRAGRHRLAGAVRGRLGDGPPGRAAAHRAARPPAETRRHRGLRARRADRRRRAGQVRAPGDHLRGVPRRRRGADLRHPGVPPAQGHRPGGGRPPQGRWAWRSRCDAIVGKTWTLRELRSEFDAVFIARRGGAARVHGRARREPQGRLLGQRVPHPRQPDERLSVPEYDTPVLHGQRVVVVGGGNVAMDSVRTARRLGAGRGHHRLPPRQEEMPARARRSTTPRRRASGSSSWPRRWRILGDDEGWVRACGASRMELGEPDASGRRRPAPSPGREFDLVRHGHRGHRHAAPTPCSRRPSRTCASNQWGYLVVDEDGMTSLPGRLRRRRHRARRSDGHPGHGRRQARRRHREVSRHRGGAVASSDIGRARVLGRPRSVVRPQWRGLSAPAATARQASWPARTERRLGWRMTCRRSRHQCWRSPTRYRRQPGSCSGRRPRAHR